MHSIHIRLDEKTRDDLDALVAYYNTQGLGTVTQSDVVRHAVTELARSKESEIARAKKTS